MTLPVDTSSTGAVCLERRKAGRLVRPNWLLQTNKEELWGGVFL